jgi:hypothetical protein
MRLGILCCQLVLDVHVAGGERQAVQVAQEGRGTARVVQPAPRWGGGPSDDLHALPAFQRPEGFENGCSRGPPFVRHYFRNNRQCGFARGAFEAESLCVRTSRGVRKAGTWQKCKILQEAVHGPHIADSQRHL